MTEQVQIEYQATDSERRGPTEAERASNLVWALLRGRALPILEAALPTYATGDLPAITIDVRGRPDLGRLIRGLGRDGGGQFVQNLRIITGAPEGTAKARARILGVALELKAVTPFAASVLVLFEWPEDYDVLQAMAMSGAVRVALRGFPLWFTLRRVPLPVHELQLLF
jgi:hypothetical protein